MSEMCPRAERAIQYRRSRRVTTASASARRASRAPQLADKVEAYASSAS